MRNAQGSSIAEHCARMETILGTRHYSPLTSSPTCSGRASSSQQYWFCKPEDLGEREVTAFLTDLALRKNVAASTQNQALSAILFFCVLSATMREDGLSCSH